MSPEEAATKLLNSLPDESRSSGTHSITETNNSSATPPGITRIYRQACPSEGREMKKSGGLVPGIGKANPTKWASESARVASHHHNTNYAGVPSSNSAEKPNYVYRMEMNTEQYKQLRINFKRG